MSRINADGTSSVALGLVHAGCVTMTWDQYDRLFASKVGGKREEHAPQNLQRAFCCHVCGKPFSRNDRVALQMVLG